MHTIIRVVLSKYEQAIKDYNQAVLLDSEYIDAYNNRGYAYQKLGHYEKATDDFEKIIQLTS